MLLRKFYGGVESLQMQSIKETLDLTNLFSGFLVFPSLKLRRLIMSKVRDFSNLVSRVNADAESFPDTYRRVSKMKRQDDQASANIRFMCGTYMNVVVLGLDLIESQTPEQAFGLKTKREKKSPSPLRTKN